MLGDMVFLGIDYGSKKIGIALSDTGGSMAFPHAVIPQDAGAIQLIARIVLEKKVGTVVIGDTLAGNGTTNTVTNAARAFGARLEKELGLPVEWFAEAGTSGAARISWGEGEVRGVVQSPRKEKQDDLHDARAAALILQRFLDVHRTPRP